MEDTIVTLTFEDRVQERDGTSRRIRELVLDRDRYQLRALVLRRGLLQADVVLPADLINPEADMARQQLLHLVGTAPALPLPRGYGLGAVAAALDQHAAGVEARGAELSDSAGLVLLRVAQPVYGVDGPIGRLDHVIVRWPDRELVALVVCTGAVRRRCVRIPRAEIVGWAGEQIHVSLDQAAVRAAPAHRSDQDIQTDVERALGADPAIRRLESGMIAVAVSDGRVTLTGHVSDGRNRERAGQLVQEVRGVREVMNELVGDAQLVDAVAAALMRVEPASRDAISFTVTHGVVMLFGTVAETAIRDAVEAVVAAVPEARMVVNTIRVPGLPEPAAAQLVQPRRGQSVFAPDGYVGRVEHAVLDPRLRQVTHIVISGDTPGGPSSGSWLDDTPRRPRKLVVPVQAIALVSAPNVFLDVDRQVVASAAELREDEYVAPAAGWQVPFPYQRDEVLWQARHAAAGRVTRPSVRPPAVERDRPVTLPRLPHRERQGQDASPATVAAMAGD